MTWSEIAFVLLAAAAIALWTFDIAAFTHILG